MSMTMTTTDMDGDDFVDFLVFPVFGLPFYGK